MTAPRRGPEWPWGLGRVLLFIAVVLLIVAWLIAAHVVSNGNFGAWLAAGLVFFALSDLL